MLTFVKREDTDQQGKYDRYNIYDIDPNNNQPYGIGYIRRGLIFEVDKYHSYKPEDIIEIAEFIKKLKNGLIHAGMGSDLMALCGTMLGINGSDQVILSYADEQVNCVECLRLRCKKLRNQREV